MIADINYPSGGSSEACKNFRSRVKQLRGVPTVSIHLKIQTALEIKFGNVVMLINKKFNIRKCARIESVTL